MTWYNPFTWFGNDDSKDSKTGDSSYEDEVQDRCDHDEATWSEAEDGESFIVTPADLGPGYDRYVAPRFVAGHAVFTVFTDMVLYCDDCGEKLVERPKQDGQVAIPVAYRIEDGVSIEDALTEEVSPEADFAVDEDGEATVIGEDSDEPGRVIVSEREFDPDAADGEVEADDKPVKAGGATD